MSSDQPRESNDDRSKIEEKTTTVEVSSDSARSQVQLSPQSSRPEEQAEAPRRESKNKKLITSFAQRYEIGSDLANRIEILDDFELVVLCDDSGSMNIPIHGTTTTRWDELRQIVKIAVDIYAAFDGNGVDVYFLNRPPMLKVKETQKVHEEFSKPPNGLTPIVPALRSILQAKYGDQSARKNLLILVATDGIPTNPKGELDLVEFEKVMRNERNATTHVTFLACTDEGEALSYLNDWDTSMDNVDVVQNFRAEFAKIQSKRGSDVKFSFGAYLVKALIGSVDPTMDAMDE